jgi:hypothetical protein
MNAIWSQMMSGQTVSGRDPKRYFYKIVRNPTGPSTGKGFCALEVGVWDQLVEWTFQHFSGRTNSGHLGRMFLKFSETP